ncbi:MAG: hypothetical protein LBJ71_04220 [Holosporaceae bacterium]|jgi:hypothetical protein|nr:hypothetical protein [Holosporaceae bacterium]
MADEINSIIQEINEELKNDQLLKFLKKNKDAILFAIVAGVVGILAYSSWYNRQNQRREEITNAILEDLQAPSRSSSLMIEGLIQDAPDELKPILSIIKNGKNLYEFKETMASAEELIELTKKRNIDIVWKDLATIIFASYKFRPTEDLIQLLEPLTKDDRPFRFTALELNAMNYESLGDYEKAVECLKEIIDTSEAPRTLKKRVTMLLSHIKNIQGKNNEKK